MAPGSGGSSSRKRRAPSESFEPEDTTSSGQDSPLRRSRRPNRGVLPSYINNNYVVGSIQQTPAARASNPITNTPTTATPLPVPSSAPALAIDQPQHTGAQADQGTSSGPKRQRKQYLRPMKDPQTKCRICNNDCGNIRQMKYSRWLNWRLCMACYKVYGVQLPFEYRTEPFQYETMVEERYLELCQIKKEEEGEKEEQEEEQEEENEEQDVGSRQRPVIPSFSIRTGSTNSPRPSLTGKSRPGYISQMGPPPRPAARNSVPHRTRRMNPPPRPQADIVFPDIFEPEEPAPMPSGLEYRPSGIPARLPSPERLGGRTRRGPFLRYRDLMRPMAPRPEGQLRDALASHNQIDDCDLSFEEQCIRSRMNPAISAEEQENAVEREAQMSDWTVGDLMDMVEPQTHEEDEPEVMDLDDE